MIASLAGADLVLAVTEPTVSGRHDLERVLRVVRQFRLPFAVIVNKADLNAQLAATIAEETTAQGALFVTTIDYDPSVTWAQVEGVDVITYGGRAAAAITEAWEAVREALGAELVLRPRDGGAHRVVSETHDTRSLVYGPVPSRRLGRSLGVDPVPFKTCTYNCVYCQIGATTHKTMHRECWVDAGTVVDQVQAPSGSRTRT